jgi:hypothetical protein
MIAIKNDIDRITVKLLNSINNTVIGTGVLYYEPKLKDRVYILTASHCLFRDGDSFQNVENEVKIGLLNPNTKNYDQIEVKVNHSLLYRDIEKDVAVLILDKREVEKIINEVPISYAIKDFKKSFEIRIKGFPKATEGNEIAALSLEWIDNNVKNTFQLQLNSDYHKDYLVGFSGAGVFLEDGNQSFLVGIVTRYRGEEKGRVIYAQYTNHINELLYQNYLPTLTYSFIGSYGLTPNFIKNKVEISINNLGDRFHKELNFKLPVAKLFNDIVRDELFILRFKKVIDQWSQKVNGRSNESCIYIGEIEVKLSELKEEIVIFERNLKYDPTYKIDIETNIENKLKVINELITIRRPKLYDFQRRESEKTKNEAQKKEYEHSRYLDDKLYRLRTIERENNNFIFRLKDKINIDLSNKPILIIKGEAGEGKSHLLGDIANKRIKKYLPTVFLLGSSNFTTAFDLRRNLLNSLELDCKFDDFLKELNHIGEQIGERVLIMIDALNEGEFQSKWKGELNGFISEILSYPYIAIVLSVRTTYYNDVIPKEIEDDSSITKYVHTGFKGNEYKALDFFCDFYGLKQPDFPILSPEFSKPLFLMMICQGVSNSKDKIFPIGFQGVNKIFNYYIDAIKVKPIFSKDCYKLNPNIIKESVEKFALSCFKINRGSHKLEDALTLFKTEFPDTPELLLDLIRENIFIQTRSTDYETNEVSDYILFTYERFGDFIIAQKLLENYASKEEVITAFRKGNELGNLINRNYWTFRGLLNAMAIVLPEKFSLEIFEVYKWRFIEEEKKRIGDDSSYFNQYLIDSLKWRSIASIDDQKITNWLNSEYFGINDEEYFNSLIELTSIKKHPFNSDRLRSYLMKFSMSERDSFWQSYIRYYSFEDDKDIAYPIRRLIDWAWMPDISVKIDEETARLTGQTLAWLLCSTHKRVRDEATKAMVNLLQNQPKALIKVLEAFKDIDDMYIAERLFAVANGCILRTNSDENIFTIAEYVYNTIFKISNPPNNILLRDYARNTIEFAIFKEIINVDEKLIRPPYQSIMPKVFPTEEEIDKYKIDYSTPNFKQNYGVEYNAIYLYVKDNDLLGDKEINYKLRNFATTSFKFNDELKEYKRNCTTKQNDFLKAFVATIQINEIQNIQNQSSEQFNLLYKKFEADINIFFKDSSFVKQKLIPHFKRTYNKNYGFNDEPIKNWIVKRAHDLGYDVKKHGTYDCFTVGHVNYRDDNRALNPISYKYIWIAFYEILAILTDNYFIKEWSEKDKPYVGSWQLNIRDIDPALITRKTENERDNSDEDKTNEFEKPKDWYHNEEYNYWQQPNADWIKSIEDLPKLKYLIEKTDNEKIDWLQLKLFSNWQEPNPIGEDKYNGKIALKDIWYKIQGLIVRKREKKAIIEHLKTENTWGNWLPESSDTDQMYNRENFWSPKYKNEGRENQWRSIRDSKFKVIVPNVDANSHFSYDKSEVNMSYEIPCQVIFKGMNLSYSDKDGETINDKGEIISTYLNGSLLIKKNELLDFLRKNNLDIIWYLLAEKRAYCRDWNHKESHYSTISGLCFYEKDELRTDLWINPKIQ